MEADFSGWATKAGLKCSDGRTIAPNAFQHQDKLQVPLVWQHGHSDPENVLGHAILENRADGVYAQCFFNNTAKAAHAKEMVRHKDINQLSIWANDLVERAKNVIHGVIREVSLVLSGANPGAVIESVSIRHSDGDIEDREDEGIIYTGLEFEHAADEGATLRAGDTLVRHTATATVTPAAGTGTGDNEPTIQDVYESMSPEQQQVTDYLVAQALEEGSGDGGDGGTGGDGGSAAQSAINNNNGNGSATTEGNGSTVRHNVFDQGANGNAGPENVLSHSDMTGIFEQAKKMGSLKAAVEAFVADEGLSHGITDIGTLFPEATTLDQQPQFLSRRMEWVQALLGAVRKSPFSRIKTLAADITLADARAKGYVTGALKKEEFFQVTRRVTVPTTIYKKQSLDRDDIVDITEFDVVTWLQAEMRVMLDEEIARAILMGDGRDISSEDKIDEQCIRPIANEHELFATTLTVNLLDASSTIVELVDQVILSRRQYKGTGTPTFFTSETVIARFLMLKDTLGRRIYANLDEVAAELRVSNIVPVEAMDDDATLLGIIVNPVDYVMGATSGGQVSLFDFFDIDYNKEKYLIETRCSGALTRLKSALVIRQSDGSSDVAVIPNPPTFDADTGVVTIVATTHIVYQNADTGDVLSTGALAALDPGETLNVEAVPASGFYLTDDATGYWTFTNDNV